MDKGDVYGLAGILVGLPGLIEIARRLFLKRNPVRLLNNPLFLQICLVASAAVSGIGWYQSHQHREQHVITGWGTERNNAWASVTPDAFEGFSPSGYYVLLIARAVDYAVDELSDPALDKSLPFVPRPGLARMDVGLSARVLGKLTPGTLQLYVMVMPVAVRPDEVRTLGDALRRGGKEIAAAEVRVEATRLPR